MLHGFSDRHNVNSCLSRFENWHTRLWVDNQRKTSARNDLIVQGLCKLESMTLNCCAQPEMDHYGSYLPPSLISMIVCSLARSTKTAGDREYWTHALENTRWFTNKDWSPYLSILVKCPTKLCSIIVSEWKLNRLKWSIHVRAAFCSDVNCDISNSIRFIRLCT